jgi:hypothetical protein
MREREIRGNWLMRRLWFVRRRGKWWEVAKLKIQTVTTGNKIWLKNNAIDIFHQVLLPLAVPAQ